MTSELERLSRIALRLDAPELIEHLNGYRRYVLRPGPVVAVVGARSRGKTALMKSVAEENRSDETASRLFLGDSELAEFGETAVILAPSGEESSILMVEAPAFDVSANGELPQRAVRTADLVLMTIMLTHPSGHQEVAFAKEHLNPTALSGRKPILVLTKSDLVDEEDFEDASQAVGMAYRDTSWNHVTVSGRGCDEDAVFGFPRFQSWWCESGASVANSAWQERRIERRHELLTLMEIEARRLRDEAASAVETAESQSALNRNLHAADALRNRLKAWISAAPEKAAALYVVRLPELKANLQAAFDAIVGDAESGRPPENPEERFREICTGWDERARAQVRHEMGRESAEFQEVREEFERLMREIDPEHESNTCATSGRQTHRNLEISTPTLTLSPQDVSAATATSGAAALAGVAAATAIGLPFTFPIFMVGVPIAMAVKRHAERSRLLAICKEARDKLESSIEPTEAELTSRFRSDWRYLAQNLEEQILDSERALNSAVRRAKRLQDSSPGQDGGALLARLQEADETVRELEELQGAV